MNLRAADYFLCRLAQRASSALKLIGDVETDLLRPRLDAIEIDRPVFITGLARAGTTILLDLFARLEPVGTHRYRDFPFLFAPCWWSWCNDRFGRVEDPIERPHRDRIEITKESPDAFEEPIWRYFFPSVSDPTATHVLTEEDDDERFDEFFTDHVRKVLLLRGKTRYVSKGNYNVTRLRYLARLFPDARFVIPVRHPVDHVGSLVRQHRLFTRYAEQDPRVPEYLRAAGHFEFGPQRMPINVEPEASARIAAAWAAGDDATGYAIGWRVVYAHADAVASDDELEGRVRFVRYEDLCARPRATMKDLLRFCGLGEHVHELDDALARISAPPRRDESDDVRVQVWCETRQVAERFGYDETGRINP